MSVILGGFFGGGVMMGGLGVAAAAPAAPSPVVQEALIRIRTTRVPIVYNDILLAWMEPWQGRVLESRRKWVINATIPCFQVDIFDKIRMAEKMFCKIQLLMATNGEILKAKELLIGEGVLNTMMSDKLRFGEERCLLIDQIDRWLGA